MYSQRPSSRSPIGFGMGGSQPPPRDLLILLAVLFVTFSLQFFDGARLLPALLRLTPLVWESFFLWQMATFPFVGYGAPGIWFLLELLILFWFSRDVYRYLGQRQFWTLLGWAVGVAALVAVGVGVLGAMLSETGWLVPVFSLMQGQRILIAVVIAAFSVLFANSTILLFFVLPVQARWFIWLEILFAFMGYLGSKDLPGFLGICAAVATTYSMLSGKGPRKILREWRLRLEQKVLEARLASSRKKRNFKVVKGGGKGSSGAGTAGNGRADGDPWVH